jgi:hypothetical protein
MQPIGHYVSLPLLNTAAASTSVFTIDWFSLLQPASSVSRGVKNPIYE